MSQELGSIHYDNEGDNVFIGRSVAQSKGYSQEVAALIDREVKYFVDSAYARCEEILKNRRHELELTARFLLEHETMTAEQFEEIFKQTAGEQN
jgi:cell division protease FtsH